EVVHGLCLPLLQQVVMTVSLIEELVRTVGLQLVERFNLSSGDHFDGLPVEVDVTGISRTVLAKDGVDDGLTVQVGIGNKVGSGGGGRPSEVVGVVHDHIAFLAGLGGNENHTESTTRTVDRCRSRVFQDGYAFNVVGVNARNVA